MKPKRGPHPIDPPLPPLAAKWLTMRAAAFYCSLHVETLRRGARSGLLQVVHIGRSLRTTREWLDDFMVERARGDVSRRDAEDIGRAPAIGFATAGQQR